MAGYPIGYFYGYKVEGVYQTDEEIAKSPKNTLATVTPGDLKFKDVNGDGEITTADRTMIGDPTPDVTYGITLGVNYKNWELGIDMMGQGGNQIFRTWDNYNWSQFNFMEQRMDRWHGPGTSNTQPLLNTKHTINNLNSEYYIEDGSFFRIRNVQLAYNFDKTLISRIGMQALKALCQHSEPEDLEAQHRIHPRTGRQRHCFRRRRRQLSDACHLYIRIQPDILTTIPPQSTQSRATRYPLR